MTGEPSRRKRGRPPHPDILTPREWQVLDLIRRGLTNEQIALRLDISVATAKYHVSEILAKLGVQTREEAAAWQPPPARGWWERAAARLITAVRRLGPLTLAKAVIAGAALAAIMGLVVFVWASGDDDESAAVAEPTTTVRSTPRLSVSPEGSPSAASAPPTGTPTAIVDPTIVFANLPGPLEENPITIEPDRELRLVGGIYRTNAAGDTLIQIAGPEDPADGAHFAFSVRSLSADGRWLAFAVRPPTNRATRGEPVFVKDLTSSAPARPLAVFGRVSYLAISPDGQRLIVDGVVDPPADPGYFDSDFYLIDVDGRTISRIPQLADAYAVAWSPAGTHLSFQRSAESGGETKLYVASADWSDIRELPSTEGTVAWSPDGSQLALAACCGKGLHIATPDGGNRFLTHASLHRSPYLPSALAWSPDGKRLVFHSRDEALGGFAIRVVDVKTGELQTLGTGEQPAWSRDGSQIAFTRDGHLFVMPSAGGQSTEITNPVQPFVDSPDWASNNTAVLFHYAPWFLESIRTITPDGSGMTHLGYGYDPVWSPDGSQVAFIGRALSAGLAGTSEVWVMNNDGSRPHKVGEYSWGDVAGCPNRIIWSADGANVIFDTHWGKTFAAPADGSGDPLEISSRCHADVSITGAVIKENTAVNVSAAVYTPDGSQLYPLGGRGGRWSPDGSRIAFWNQSGIHVAEYPSGESRPVAALSSTEWGGRGPPDLLWAPDGSWLVYSLGSRHDERTAWAVSAVGGPGPFLIGSGGDATWAPDSRRIAFTDGSQPSDQVIYLADVEQPGEATRIIEGTNPTWSPNGAFILFTR